jgi:hypothetical protein
MSISVGSSNYYCCFGPFRGNVLVGSFLIAIFGILLSTFSIGFFIFIKWNFAQQFDDFLDQQIGPQISNKSIFSNFNSFFRWDSIGICVHPLSFNFAANSFGQYFPRFRPISSNCSPSHRLSDHSGYFLIFSIFFPIFRQSIWPFGFALNSLLPFSFVCTFFLANVFE